MRNRSSASLQLAGGVAGERQRQVVGVDAAAVVDDADQFGAALLEVDVDAGGPGIDGVLEQLLDDADAGRSITSPAAILVTTDGGSWWMRGMKMLPRADAKDG